MSGDKDLSVNNNSNVPSYVPPSNNTSVENEEAGIIFRETYSYGVPADQVGKNESLWDVVKRNGPEITFNETCEANSNPELVHEGDWVKISSPGIKKTTENVKKAIQYYEDKYYFEVTKYDKVIVYPIDEIDIATITEDLGVSWQELAETNDFSTPEGKKEYSIGDKYIDEVGTYAAENGDDILNGRIKKGNYIVIDGKHFRPIKPVSEDIKKATINTIASNPILSPILTSLVLLFQKSQKSE